MTARAPTRTASSSGAEPQRSATPTSAPASTRALTAARTFSDEAMWRAVLLS